MRNVLAYNSDLFSNLHDNLPGFFYRCKNDDVWTMLSMSKGCHSITGYTAESFINNAEIAYGDIILPEDAEWLNPKCVYNLDNHLACNNEYRIQTKTGQIKWVKEIANGVYSETGELLYIEGYITESVEPSDQLMINNAFASYQTAVNEHSLVAITDKEGVILFVNEHFLHCSGYDRSDLIGQKISILNSNYHPPAFFKNLWDTISKGQVWHQSIRNKSKNGDLCWVDMVISPVFNDQNEIVQFLSIMNVVTDTIESKRQLTESENRLKMAQSIAKIGSWEYIVSENLLIWSEELYRLYQIDQNHEGNLLDVFYSRVHPDDIQQLNDCFSAALQFGTPYEIQHRTILPTKEELHYFCTAMAEYDNDNKVVKIIGTAQDVTNRVIQEKRIKHLGELNKQIIDASDDLFYVFKMQDPGLVDNPLIYISDKVIDFYGVTAQDFKTNHNLWFESIHPDDVALVAQKTDELFQSKKTNTREYRIKNWKTNEYIWVSDFLQPVLNKEGNMYEVFGSLKNIQQLKEKEFQLETTLSDLLDRYNELMQFNYIVSHNLRSPLSNIIGTVNLYEMEGITEREKSTIIDFIKTSSNKMDDVLKDLNTILATRSAAASTKEPVILSKLFNGISNTLEKQLFDAEMSIKLELDQSVVAIETVKSYLESICYNLILNAIKYKSPDRLPALIIRSEVVDRKLLLSFKDNGLGIDLDRNGKNMFGLYKRFHTNIEGKGIGLFMTKTQVETIGGKISVESELDKGTTFTIELPLS
jgi:PAS domain S-box-containing protein